YGLLVTPGGARAFRIGAGRADLDREVDAIRATISVEENGQVVTYPFDVAGAHELYQQLFGPVSVELAGAMLRLPPNLLVTDAASVETYRAKTARPDSDGFDFTGVAWLGRGRDS